MVWKCGLVAFSDELASSEGTARLGSGSQALGA